MIPGLAMPPGLIGASEPAFVPYIFPSYSLSNVTKALTLPAVAEAGDILMVFGLEDDGSGTVVGRDIPAGFTSIRNVTGDNHGHGVSYKIAAGGEHVLSFPVTGAGPDDLMGFIIRARALTAVPTVTNATASATALSGTLTSGAGTAPLIAYCMYGWSNNAYAQSYNFGGGIADLASGISSPTGKGFRVALKLFLESPANIAVSIPDSGTQTLNGGYISFTY